MNVLDWILVVVVVAYAVSGYWQGFIAGAFATVGLVAGGIFGIWLAPKLLGDVQPSFWVSIGAIFVVLLAASLGQAVLQHVGARVRAAIRWQPVRVLDAIGGAALSVCAVLVVLWMLGVAVSGASIPGVTAEVRSSTVLKKVNAVMPTVAQRALGAFNNVVGSSFFPRYLEPFAPEQILTVPPAPAGVARDPEILQAANAVYKIRGNNSCGQGVEGSGFLYAPHRIMTNAHVVAGVPHPQVLVGTRMTDAEVVYYNPRIDVAVLADPSVTARPLRFENDGHRGQVGAALGFPEDGPYTVRPARIRNQQRLQSPNIYGQETVTRDVFAIRSIIRPGNSGGPLVSASGRVLGVVFAASVTDSQTGYALTAGQVAEAASAGRTATAAVSSQGCA